MDQQIFNEREVSGIIGVSQSTLRRMVKRQEFPQSVALSRGRRGWFRNDIENYIKEKMNQRSEINEQTKLAFSKTWRAKLGEQK